jgi:hypothetical protein
MSYGWTQRDSARSAWPAQWARPRDRCCRMVPGWSGRSKEAATSKLMALYYEHMGWGVYTTEFDSDYQPYPMSGLESSSTRVKTGSNSR